MKEHDCLLVKFMWIAWVFLGELWPLSSLFYICWIHVLLCWACGHWWSLVPHSRKHFGRQRSGNVLFQCFSLNVEIGLSVTTNSTITRYNLTWSNTMHRKGTSDNRECSLEKAGACLEDGCYSSPIHAAAPSSASGIKVYFPRCITWQKQFTPHSDLAFRISICM